MRKSSIFEHFRIAGLKKVAKQMGCDFSQENMYTLPGEQIWTGTYEEYHLDTDALNALMIELFYELK